MKNNKITNKETINNKTANKKVFEFINCGYTVRIQDDSIKTQNMEVLKNGEVIANIKEIVLRLSGCVKVCYDLNGDLFDTLEEAIQTLDYNLNK